MSPRNVLYPRDLAVLRRVFVEHCQKHRIMTPEGRDSVAASLMVNYQNGIHDPEELKTALDREEASPAEVAF